MENIDRLVQLITDRLLEKMTDKPMRGSVYVVGEEPIKAQLEEQGFALTDDMTGADAVVVDCLSVDSFLRLANLCPTTGIESQLLTALLTGKSVLVATEALKLDEYKKTAKLLLYRNLLKQKETLEKYGVRFYSEGQLMNLLIPEKEKIVLSNVVKHREVSSVDLISQKERKIGFSQPKGKRLLITETKLREMDLTDGSTFKMEKGMMITALAKDYLNRHHITIVE